MEIEITKQFKIRELKRCKNPIYFISNFVYIKHPIDGKVPFKVWDFQERVLEDFQNHRFNIILKSRQLGLSTVTSAYILWLMLFNKNSNIATVSIKREDAVDIIEKIKYAYENLPDWLKISKIKNDNVFEFSFANGSKVKATATTSNIARGQALTLLFIDEAAFIDGLDEAWSSAWPTLSTGGSAIINSTPNGATGFFYDMWKDAEESLNDFHNILLPWNAHPDRDQEWYESTKKNMPDNNFAQEYLCDFMLSGNTVISPEIINKLRDKIRPPKHTEGPGNNLWIWEDYDYKSTYIMTIDTARGDGGDYSAFHVVNTSTIEVVAEFKGKVTIDIFSDLVFEIGFRYGLCLVIPENNSVGNSLIEKLIDKEYPSLFYSEKTSYRFVSQFEAAGRDDCVPGLFVNAKTRPWLITKWEEYMRKEIYIIYSSRYLTELENFIYHNGKPQSKKGKNDDLVICAALACWVRDTALSVNTREIEYKMQFLNAIKKTTHIFDSSMTPDYSQQFKFKGTDGKYRDYSWILKG